MTEQHNLPAVVAHANLGASSSKRWMNCTISPSVIATIPADRQNPESDFAREGTDYHTVAAICLKEGRDAGEFVDRVVGKTLITDDGADDLQLYLDTVRQEYHPEDGDILFIETQFSLAELKPPEPMFGTTDAAVFHPKTGKLVVIDLKFGRGVAVDATGNTQGRYYALGACIALKDHAVRAVEIVIVQPRAPHRLGPIRRDTVTVFELLEWSEELLAKAAETRSPSATFAAGEWCRFCPALAECPKARAVTAALGNADWRSDKQLDTVNLPDPLTLTNDEIARVAQGGTLLVQWYRAVMALLADRLMKGEIGSESGFKLVARRARRQFAYDVDNPEELKKLLAKLMVEFDLSEAEIYEQKLKSPAKMLANYKGKGSGKKKEAMETALIRKVSSGYTIAPVDDARPSVDASLAAEFAPQLPNPDSDTKTVDEMFAEFLE